jgi:membrane protease YdiL (CAAX protease family)
MNKRQILTISIFAIFFAVCPIATFISGSESKLAHAVHSILTALAIFSLNDWKTEKTKANFGFATSILFLFGAFFISMKSIDIWFALTKIAEPATRIVQQAQTTNQVEELFNYRITTIILSPLVEEIIFRVGFLGLLMKFINKKSALLLSSVAFAEMHFAVMPQWMMVPLTILGITLGITYLSLGLPWAIFLHAAYNYISEYGLELRNPQINLAVSLVYAVGSIFFIFKMFQIRKTIFN